VFSKGFSTGLRLWAKNLRAPIFQGVRIPVSQAAALATALAATAFLCTQTHTHVSSSPQHVHRLAPRDAGRLPAALPRARTAPATAEAGRAAFKPGHDATLQETTTHRQVRGTVWLEGGGPAAGAQIGIDEFTFTQADAHGRFTLALEPGTHFVFAFTESHDGYDPARTIVLVPAEGSPQPRKLVLPRTPWSYVNLRILDAKDAPAPEVRTEGKRTDEEGRLRLAFRARPGTRRTLTLRVDALLDAVCPRVEVETSPYEPGPEQVVRLPPERRVTFHVRASDGVPLPEGAEPHADASDDGRCQDLEPLAEGRLVLRFYRWPKDGLYLDFWGSGYGHTSFRLRRPVERREVRLHREAFLTGTVVEPDGSPAAGVDVFGEFRTKTDDAGRFLLRGLRTGDHTLSIYRDFGESMLAELRHEAVTTEATRTDVGTLVLPRRVAVRGVCVDRAGKAVAGVSVSCRSKRLPIGGYARSGKDGTFAFDVPDNQEWRVVASADGYCTRSFPLRLGEPLRIVLEPEGRVRLHVRGLDWNLVRAYQDGHYVPLKRKDDLLHRLPAGVVRVVLARDRAMVAEREVEVVPGRTVDLDFP